MMDRNESCIEKGKETAIKTFKKIMKPVYKAEYVIHTDDQLLGPELVILRPFEACTVMIADSSLPFAFFAGAVSEKIGKIKDVGQVEKAEAEEAKLRRDYYSR